MQTTQVEDATQKRITFFRHLFGDAKGYVCLAWKELKGAGKFSEEFFYLPDQMEAFVGTINMRITMGNIYFCPHLFLSPERRKNNVASLTALWADLDTCDPENLLVKPTFVLETSERRYQAFWALNEEAEPVEAEEICKQIAYRHADEGCDKSGWDITQLLRVPLTYNFKYQLSDQSHPVVKIKEARAVRYDLVDFDGYPAVKEISARDIEFPDMGEIPNPEEVLFKYRTRLPVIATNLYQVVPERDWSGALWQLQMTLFEAGLSREEVFAVAREAACNKYKRDGKPELWLWREVCKAWMTFEETQRGWVANPNYDDALLTDDERKAAESETGFIEEYVEWAKTLGDAAWQYHEVGAFTILSSLIAGYVKVPTSFGIMVPNLWFMILADTTLTRKTTAMDLAIDIVQEVDSNSVLATDGSIEGLFSSLGTRPGRPSVFLRDEFSGLLESMVKKDYYAGMMETLTKLYDGKYQKRILRKEIIEVKDPVLIIFAGGIKSRVQSQLTYEHVGSGFLPRFLFVSAESDISKLRPMGPPSEATLGGREIIITKLQALHAYYTSHRIIRVAGRDVPAAPDWRVKLTPEAWQRYNKFEADMVEFAMQTTIQDIMVPMMDRMSKSGLKMASLLAATHMKDNVVVEESDMIKAISYIERWRPYSVDILKNIGKSTYERSVEQVLRSIEKTPGILRSTVMSNFHISARDMENILLTLDQRQQISRQRQGRTERLFIVGK